MTENPNEQIAETLEKTPFISEIVKNPLILKLLSAVICIIVGFILLAIVRKLIDRLLESEKASKLANKAKLRTLGNIFYSIIKFIVIFFIITGILDIFGINTSALIATAGIGGIAVAFASQSVIADFIRGIFIILDDKIRVGDWVYTASAEGDVTEVNLRTTKIKDFNGSIHIIPNSQIEKVQNFNRGPQMADVTFRLSYETDLKDAKAIIDTVAAKLKEGEFKDSFVEDFSFFEINSFDEFSYKVRMTAIVEEGLQWAIGRKARELVKLEMEKRGIKASLVGYENEEV